MAFLLLHRRNDYQIINPANGEFFTSDEVKLLIGVDEYLYYHILTHDSRFSRFILAYGRNNLNDIGRINILATRAYLKGHYKPKEYALLMAAMRLNPIKFFEEHDEINFISGAALIGTTQELKKYNYKELKR